MTDSTVPTPPPDAPVYRTPDGDVMWAEWEAEPQETDADARVRRYILRRWRDDNPDHADCATLHVVTAETQFALFYDTGVEGVAFTAELACEHRGQFDYEFGELGELPDIIEALDEEDA